MLGRTCVITASPWGGPGEFCLAVLVLSPVRYSKLGKQGTAGEEQRRLIGSSCSRRVGRLLACGVTPGDRRVAALPMEPAFRAPGGGCGLEVLWAARLRFPRKWGQGLGWPLVIETLSLGDDCYRRHRLLGLSWRWKPDLLLCGHLNNEGQLFY